MSFKGIAWAGNVYEKFEAMCLEVEEAMYQDTVKYMENQVQKVGVSVKKFCSEVMDDLRPLSCVDPTSLASDDSSLIPHGFTDVHKKPIPSILSKKENEDQVLSGKGSFPSGHDVKLFSPQSPGIFIENKSSDKCAASKKIGIHRRPIGIKRISRNNHPTKESSRDTSVSEDRSKVVNCDRTSSRLASDNTDVTSSSDLNGRCKMTVAFKEDTRILDNSFESPASDKMSSTKSLRQDTTRVVHDDTNGASSSGLLVCESGAAVKGNTPCRDNPLESPHTKEVSPAEPLRQIENVVDYIPPASDNNLLDESVRLKGDPESTSSCFSSPKEFPGTAVNDTPFSPLGTSIRSKVCNLEYEEEVTLPVDGAIMKDGSSSASSTPGNTESCNKDFITSGDSFEMEFVENEEVGEARVEKFETSILEESCILVEGDELHHAHVLERTKKHKSYKKRIREAISSKLKPRKDEFVVGDKKQEMSASGKQKLSTLDSVESDDWELL